MKNQFHHLHTHSLNPTTTTMNDQTQNQVMETQERFDTPLVTASRKHEKEGELIKMCRKVRKKQSVPLSLGDVCVCE